MNAEELAARLTDLELRFMRLERYAHELSDVVATQQRAIDALVAEAKRLRERATDEGRAVPNEPPPHY
jgi:uncharacterized coiled-coil protein SlyX